MAVPASALERICRPGRSCGRRHASASQRCRAQCLRTVFPAPIDTIATQLFRRARIPPALPRHHSSRFALSSRSIAGTAIRSCSAVSADCRLMQPTISALRRARRTQVAPASRRTAPCPGFKPSGCSSSDCILIGDLWRANRNWSAHCIAHTATALAAAPCMNLARILPPSSNQAAGSNMATPPNTSNGDGF